MNTQIQLCTKYKLVQKINPYEENLPAWHCFLDCSWDSEGTIADLMSTHDQLLEYYQLYLGQLVEDGVLILEYHTHGEAV